MLTTMPQGSCTTVRSSTGPPRKVAAVDAVAEAAGEEGLPHEELGPCVLAPDGGHDAAAGGRCPRGKYTLRTAGFRHLGSAIGRHPAAPQCKLNAAMGAQRGRATTFGRAPERKGTVPMPAIRRATESSRLSARAGTELGAVLCQARPNVAPRLGQDSRYDPWRGEKAFTRWTDACS